MYNMERKFKSRLPKRYYFPMVEGSNYGYAIWNNEIVQGFVSYLRNKKTGNWVKIASFSQTWNYFMRAPILFRKGYHVNVAEYLMVEKANKYLDRQYCRLERLLKQKKYNEYSNLCKLLRTNSQLFVLAILVRKCSRYAEIYSAMKIRYMAKDIISKIRKADTRLNQRRVFIPEYDSNGKLRKFRPLGVPTVEWRIIMATYEFYLTNLWADKWLPNMFGVGTSGKGVSYAWIKILEKLIVEWKNPVTQIIGIDLWKFFDTVNIERMARMCMQEMVPFEIARFLGEICLSKIKVNPKDRKKEEKRIKETYGKAPQSAYEEDAILMKVYQEWGVTERVSRPLVRGLPQGLPTSPILACKFLDYSEAPNIQRAEVIQYIDDAVLFSREATNKEIVKAIRDYKGDLVMNLTGMQVSDKKTEVIMKDGRWVKPLKFLGLSYDGETFKAHTRKGVYEIHDAKSRFEEIREWLLSNERDLLGYKKFNKYIADSWLKTDGKIRWYEVPMASLYSLMGLNAGPNNDTVWESTKVKTSEIHSNSIEARVIERWLGTYNPVLWSTNTMSMMNAAEVLKIMNKSRKVKTIVRYSVRNRLELDW